MGVSTDRKLSSLRGGSQVCGRDAQATDSWQWWRDRREQMVLTAEDILGEIESVGYQVTGGRESIGDGQEGPRG